MPVEAGHIQLTEYRKTTIPYLNWMFEDLFCRYDVSIPYYLLDFSFPDYPLIAEWPAPYSPEWLELYRPSLPPWPEMPWWNIPEMVWPEMKWPEWPKLQWPDWFSGTGFDWVADFNGFSFNTDWGKAGYDLTWLNELLGLLFDLADIPRWQMPDFSKKSIATLNDYITMLYDAAATILTIYYQVGTFEVGETITGETSGATGVLESATATSLTLTDVVGTFSDEMITGETSEAYAWTYDASTELTIYDQIGTFEVGETVVGATSEATGTLEVATATILTLSDVTGTFSEDEKVTGQTSDAYAFTSEVVWESPLRVYNEVSPTWAIGKYGTSPNYGTISDAWDDYDAKEVTGGEDDTKSSSTYWGVWPDGVRYQAGGQVLCFTFDTTDAPTEATTITLKFRVDVFDDSYGTPMLELYKLSEAFTTSYYCSGGTYITEEQITGIGRYTITLSNSNVNAGGITRLKVTLNAVCGSEPGTEVMQKVGFDAPYTTQVYLTFTR